MEEDSERAPQGKGARGESPKAGGPYGWVESLEEVLWSQNISELNSSTSFVNLQLKCSGLPSTNMWQGAQLEVVSKCMVVKTQEQLTWSQPSSRRVTVEDRTLGNSLKEEAEGIIQQAHTKEGKRQGESEEWHGCLDTNMLVPSTVCGAVWAFRKSRWKNAGGHQEHGADHLWSPIS